MILARGDPGAVSRPVTYSEANRLQRAIRWFAASRLGAWFFARALPRVDRPVYRLTGGRHTFASLVSALPVVMLRTTGARSGRSRQVPVLGLPTPDGVAVIASNFGQRHHPAWYHNLRAHPDAEVTLRGVAIRVRAVEPEGVQRARIWEEGLRVYPGWSQYARRATNRQIAVFLLVPVGG